MTLLQFLTVLRARWMTAALLWGVCVAVATALWMWLPRQFVASASVVLDVKSADPIAGLVSPGGVAPGYMATQVDIMTSDRVAQRVVRALKLDANADMRTLWQRDSGGKGNFEVWMGRLLQRKLDVRPARESNVIEVRFTSPEAGFAAVVANAFVQAYLDTLLDLRVDPARRYTAFFEDRVRRLREELERAQGRLSAHQRRKGITANDERLDVETARLNELSSQWVAVQAVAADGRSRRVAAATAADTMQEVLGNPVVAGLRTELARLEAREQELRERLGDRHPQALELRANIDSVRSKLELESKRLAASVGVNSIISESREAQVRTALEAQRTRVLQMKNERDELTVLQRDVENAQRAYEAVSSRLTQSSLESVTTQTNASVLMVATEPSLPAFPRASVLLPLGALGGLLLAAAGVLARESADRRIRTAEDVLQDLALPVLATLLPQHQRAPAAVQMMRAAADAGTGPAS
ncbi:MAG: chain length determinant protein EpsF [Aquabacterium sp.]